MPSEGQGGDVQPTAGKEVQSNDQGLIQPYLDDVDPEIRDLVASKLEAFRKDQDANVNKKMQTQAEQLNAYKALGSPESLEFTVSLYQGLVNDPVETIKWVTESYETETGTNLKEDLAVALALQQAHDEAVEAGDKPLTASEVQKLLKDESERTRKEIMQTFESAEERTAAEARAEEWLNAASARNSVTLADSDKEYVVHAAYNLLSSGKVTDGQQAIDMAVDAFVSRFESVLKPPTNKAKAPKVAKGGSSAPAPSFDPSNAAERKAAALALLQAQGD